MSKIKLAQFGLNHETILEKCVALWKTNVWKMQRKSTSFIMDKLIRRFVELYNDLTEKKARQVHLFNFVFPLSEVQKWIRSTQGYPVIESGSKYFNKHETVYKSIFPSLCSKLKPDKATTPEEEYKQMIFDRFYKQNRKILEKFSLSDRQKIFTLRATLAWFHLMKVIMDRKTVLEEDIEKRTGDFATNLDKNHITRWKRDAHNTHNREEYKFKNRNAAEIQSAGTFNDQYFDDPKHLYQANSKFYGDPSKWTDKGERNMKDPNDYKYTEFQILGANMAGSLGP